MTSVLRNPYYHAGVIVARLAVNVATLIWSVVVLGWENALAPASYGAILTNLAHENLWAAGFGILSLCSLYRLCRKSPPHPIAIVIYGALLLAWGFVEVIILFVQRPLQPTATATVSVIFALALYSFVANPKSRPDATA